jgi:hypothetical protein
MGSTLLDDAYFEKHDWSGWQVKSWEALTEKPCVCASDDPRTFKVRHELHAATMRVTITQCDVI